MITITRESNYAHGLTFENVEAVELEVSGLAPHRDMTRYEGDTDARYVARLLDLPESHVRVEEVITLTRSQLRKLESDMAQLVNEMKEGEAWPTDAYDLVADTICAWVYGPKAGGDDD